MSRLPEDIIEENILTKLPVKSISRFRCVSRNWNLLFRNPKFIKNHLNHTILMNKFNILVYSGSTRKLYSIHDINLLSSSSTTSPFSGHVLQIDFPYMALGYRPQILGSSNGLVCIQAYFSFLFLWNQATREYKQVPRYKADQNDYFVAQGFGFDCKKGDYKVLRIIMNSEVGEGSEARVYSLASDSWKNLGTVPYNFVLSSNGGLIHNGVLHWIAPRLESWVIVCFDVSEEKFWHVPLPYKSLIEDRCTPNMGIWEGKLCLVNRIHTEDPNICTHRDDHIDVWTMIDNKWSKQLKFPAHLTDMHHGTPLLALQNGEILLKGRPRGEMGVDLLSYDPNLERSRVLRIHGCPQMSDNMETYIETLVALNSGVYVGQEQCGSGIMNQESKIVNKRGRRYGRKDGVNLF